MNAVIHRIGDPTTGTGDMSAWWCSCACTRCLSGSCCRFAPFSPTGTWPPTPVTAPPALGGPYKCPDCGVWWAGFEHRCQTLVTTTGTGT